MKEDVGTSKQKICTNKVRMVQAQEVHPDFVHTLFGF